MNETNRYHILQAKPRKTDMSIWMYLQTTDSRYTFNTSEPHSKLPNAVALCVCEYITPLPYTTHDQPSRSCWPFAAGQEHSVAVCRDRKSTRLNSSHLGISYAVFCLKK